MRASRWQGQGSSMSRRFCQPIAFSVHDLSFAFSLAPTFTITYVHSVDNISTQIRSNAVRALGNFTHFVPEGVLPNEQELFHRVVQVLVDNLRRRGTREKERDLLPIV